MPESPPIRTHQDPALFREAVNYTTAATRFPSRLIEKDYFCTVILRPLAEAECGPGRFMRLCCQDLTRGPGRLLPRRET